MGLRMGIREAISVKCLAECLECSRCSGPERDYGQSV